MGTYDSEVNNAYTMISEKGGVARIVQPDTKGTYSPVSDSYSASSTGSSFTTYAVKADYEEKYVDGTVIAHGDCKFLVPAKNADFTPVQGDKIVFGSVYWDIKHINILDPAGNQEILYTLQGRS